MKETIKKQRLFFISLIGIVIVSLAMSLTYAYQTVQIDKIDGADTDLTIDVGLVDVTFKKTTDSINLTNMPLLKDYKSADYVELEIDNQNSTANVAYQLVLKELTYSPNLATKDFKYTITRILGDKEFVINSGDFSSLSNAEPFTTSVELNMHYNTYNFVDKGKKDTIRLYLWLEETSEEQNSLENNSFQAKINIQSTFTNIIKNSEINKFNIYGNNLLVYQEGTTEQGPTTPATIEFLGSKVTDETSEYYGKYEVGINVKSKNLWKTDINNMTMNGVTLTTMPDGTIYLNGTCTSSVNFLANTISLSEGTYSLSANNTQNNGISQAIVQIYSATTKESLTCYDNTNNSKNENVSLTASDDYVLRIRIENGKTYENYIIKPQLEEGTTITEYVPYKEPKSYSIYLDEPLKKVDNYSDYIDVVNNKVVRKINKYTLSRANNWTHASVLNDNTYRAYIGANANSPIQDGIKDAVLCNYFKSAKWAYRATTGYGNSIFVGSDNASATYMGIQIRIDSSIANNGTSFLNYLDSLDEPLTIYNPSTTIVSEEPILMPFMDLESGDIVTACSSNNVCASNVELDLKEY